MEGDRIGEVNGEAEKDKKLWEEESEKQQNRSRSIS